MVGNKIILNMVSSVIATSLTIMISPNETAGQLISGISKLIPDILESCLEKTQVEENLIKSLGIPLLKPFPERNWK